MKKGTIVTTLCSVACMCLLGGGAALKTNQIETKAATNTFVVGAEIKCQLDNTIRFNVEIDQATFANFSEDTTTSGLLIIPSDKLTGTLDINTASAINKQTYGVTSEANQSESSVEWTINNDGNYQKTVVLEEIPALSYNRELTAVAYYYENVNSVTYSDVTKCSIADIALSVIADTSADAPAPELKEALKGYLNDYSVKFDYDDGVTEAETQLVEYGSEFTAPEEHPFRANYKFLGWYERTDANGETPTYAETATDFSAENVKTVKSGRQFIAKWEEMEADVLYNPAELGVAGLKVTNGGGTSSDVVYGSVSDANYSGEYISIERTNNNTQNTTFYFISNDALTARLNNFISNGYTYLKVWAKVESIADTVALTWFAGPTGNSLVVTVRTNQWVQIELPISNFNAEYTYTGAHWSSNLLWTEMSKFYIGEVVAAKHADDIIYSPIDALLHGLTIENANGAAGSGKYYGGDLSDKNYTGSYISLTSTNSSGLTTVRIVKDEKVTNRLTTLSQTCTKVKVWVKLVSTGTETVNMTWCAGAGLSSTISVPVNEWTQVELGMANFKGTYEQSVWQTYANLNQNGLTELRIGEIVGAKHADGIIYSPMDAMMSGVSYQNGGGAAGSGKYYGGDLSDKNYTGSYISLTSTNSSGLTTVRIVKDEKVTNRLTTLSQTYTKVKVWVKVVSTGTETVNMTWCAGTGLSSTISVPVNVWTQVELGMANFKGTYEQGVWQTYANLNQNGVTELRIGEIIAV